MTKRKKIILSLIAAISAILLGFACFFGVQYYLKSRIEFNVKDTLPDGEGRRAHVIILAGQSNASGCSLDEYLKKKVSEEKYAEYQNGYENVYINYLSGANRSEEFVKCRTLQGEPAGTFGPELGLAEKLHELYPDETFFIVKCAWGGTNLFKQWLSPSSKGKTGELYKQFVSFVETSVQYLESKNYDVQIEAMCWMQGESDSFSVKDSQRYGERLNNLITDVREKFSKYSADDGIAFVDAYIAPNPTLWVYYEGVNRGKDEVAALSEMNVLVDTILAGLDCSQEPLGAPDIAHYDSSSEIKLGHLFAEEISAFLD